MFIPPCLSLMGHWMHPPIQGSEWVAVCTHRSLGFLVTLPLPLQSRVCAIL